MNSRKIFKVPLSIKILDEDSFGEILLSPTMRARNSTLVEMGGECLEKSKWEKFSQLFPKRFPISFFPSPSPAPQTLSAFSQTFQIVNPSSFLIRY